MLHINSEVLQEFERRGLSITEGIAVDARIVKSASRPKSNEELKKYKDKRESPDGRLDKNGQALKFKRDLGSDWVAKNDEPHYGLKEHASVDIKNGLILATTLSPCSVNDTNYLPYLTLASCHTKDPIEKVYVDKGYYGKPNSTFLHLNEIKDGLRLEET